MGGHRSSTSRTKRLLAAMSSGAMVAALGVVGGVTVDVALLAPAANAAPPATSVAEFQPTVPTKYGGRSVSVTLNAANTDQVIVATESGGLFRSNDGGANWSHVDSFPLHRT